MFQFEDVVRIVERPGDAQAHGLDAAEHILILQHLQAKFGTGQRGWAGDGKQDISRTITNLYVQLVNRDLDDFFCREFMATQVQPKFNPSSTQVRSLTWLKRAT